MQEWSWRMKQKRSDINTNHYRWSLIPDWVVLGVAVERLPRIVAADAAVAAAVAAAATALVSATVATVAPTDVDDFD